MLKSSVVSESTALLEYLCSRLPYKRVARIHWPQLLLIFPVGYYTSKDIRQIHCVFFINEFLGLEMKINYCLQIDAPLLFVSVTSFVFIALLINNELD